MLLEVKRSYRMHHLFIKKINSMILPFVGIGLALGPLLDLVLAKVLVVEGYGEYMYFRVGVITSALARFGIGDYIMMMVPKLKIKNTDIGNKIIALSINNTLAGVVIIYVSVFGLYFFQESEALSGGSTSLNIAVFLWVWYGLTVTF